MTIAGTRISGGMIYVGRELSIPGRFGSDHCLINPSLKVAPAVRAGEPLGLHYYPDYASLTPAARRAYLDWLADGRSERSVEIGLVFLFFYGLERRLFLERQVADAPDLAAEVRRLLAIHGDNPSFRSYATNFLSAAALASGSGIARVEPQPIADYVTEIPFATRVHLGAMLAEGRPLAADDALLWVLGIPETRLRTPGQRCFVELRQLFALRFAERHPSGLAVRKPKRRLTAIYRAAAGSFTADIPGSHECLPDISAISAPVAGLLTILEACQTDLEAYSRLLGRKPGARGSLEAALLLPAPLQEAATRAALEPVRARIVALLPDDGMGTVFVRPLFAALGLPLTAAGKITLAATNQAGMRLDALGFGMEPDRRYGGGAVAANAEVVLFRAERGARVDPDRPDFVTAKAAIEVAMLAAVADGALTGDEFAAVLADARAMRGLLPAEQLRLEALVWTLRERARTGTTLKRAAALPEHARRAIATAAVTAVLADGNASPREVAFVERVHRALGLPVEALHAALHQGAAIGRRLIVDGTVPNASGPRATGSGVALDVGRLERIRAETSAVSALLSGIFGDDEAEAATAVPPAPAGNVEPPPFDGLDLSHGKLLARLIAARRMDPDAFESEAKTLHLLPDGAAETINDWAFDRFGEAVLDIDGDGVAVADHLMRELATAGGIR